MDFECTKRFKCAYGIEGCCYCCDNPPAQCAEPCADIDCEDLNKFAKQVHLPVARLKLSSRHFHQGTIAQYKKELREEILQRMKSK
jgi:hypothetical protein